LGVTIDITDRVRAEEALRQAQKTESLGVLAGGIAHDFNNLLVAMLGQASLALAQLPPESPARAPIEKAVKAAERGADLARQMLAYSGRGQFERRPIHLNTLIHENLHLFEVAVPKNVQLRMDLAEALPPIEGDIGQMQQVVMNLIINAAEAIGERPGTVRMITGMEDVRAGDDRLWRYTNKPLAPGRYVTLEVRDNGSGMDAETLSKIFDPFFTTKFTGRGLGLAAVLGIVRGHKGGLLVDSAPGHGTTFKLYFPADSAELIQPLPPDTTPPAHAPAGGLVLVIDDEQPVREAVTDILELDGLQVITASGGAAGIALYQKRQADVRLVLLDLSMPGMGGEETFRRLRAINPDARVILSSGYSQAEATRHFVGQGLAGFIQKPYNASTLVKTIRQHLAD
jgi:nitrogen-specific signal transduction histidine kinase/CheY-like chemotaxis protein